MRAIVATFAIATLLSRFAASGQQPAAPDAALFVQAASRDSRAADAALETIAARWRDGYAAMIVDLARLMRPARTATPAAETISADPESVTSGASDPATPRQMHPSSIVRARLIRFLQRQTGKRFGDDLWRWREWIWQLPYDPHPQYLPFKGEIYAQIDPRFRDFFQPDVKSVIRLDEVDWGGVPVNGIPPLDRPRTIAATQARYLKDDHLVFGLVVNGEARAYPKRILAWHELARDRVGGIDLTIVYCTLCGTVIPYESRAGSRMYTFGTSGLLYRSNKLMFDEETKSLWSTLEGRPAIGPLAGTGVELTSHPVVTTTWGEWKRMHPSSTVLALETGFRRDYSEGAAYRDYFSHDRLMFAVPLTDRRLRNKAEVLTVFVRGETGARLPAAIAVDLLKRKPVYHFDVGNRRFVVLTTKGGANRVYDAAGQSFSGAADDVVDAAGTKWQAGEDALVTGTRRLARVPAQRAFWFAWYAQFPNTALFK